MIIDVSIGVIIIVSAIFGVVKHYGLWRSGTWLTRLVVFVIPISVAVACSLYTAINSNGFVVVSVSRCLLMVACGVTWWHLIAIHIYARMDEKRRRMFFKEKIK